MSHADRKNASRSPDGGHTDHDGLPRRPAIAIILAGAGAIGGGLLALILGFLSNALGRQQQRSWLRVGLAADLNAETFEKYILYENKRNGWRRERVPRVVYIKDLYPKDPLALSATCTHLGCSVKWNEGGTQFQCPCHGGQYDDRGQVVAGPPPAPLARLEVKLEDDVCFVRMPGSGAAAQKTR